jgi:hypothetical protein
MTGQSRVLAALRYVLAIGGYAATIAFLFVGFQSGRWPFPGGDVLSYYYAAGEGLRNGTQVYIPGFLYGPPWAVAFAGVGILGAGAIHAVILALDVVALWVIAGGRWQRLGFLLWFPLISFELAAGQLNLLIAAAIVAAQRGSVWGLAVLTTAKVWPIVALPVWRWRPFVLTLALLVVATLPWLDLWPKWAAALIAIAETPLGPLVPIPWSLRLAAAAGLLLLRRPWATALAASISSPNLYWGQLVVLVAPLCLWLDRRELDAKARQGAAPAGAAVAEPASLGADTRNAERSIS